MIIKNGIVADPASGLYEQMDILVKDGKIVKIAPDISCASDAAATEKEEIIDASGMIVGPGLIDTHVHFRDPDFTYKEDLMSGSRAAANRCGYPHRFPGCRKGWLHNCRVHGKHKAYSGQCGYSKGQPHTWKAGKNPYVSGRCNIALPQRTG